MLMLLFSDLDFDVDTFGGSCVVVDGSVVCGGNVGDIVFVVAAALVVVVDVAIAVVGFDVVR